MPGATSGRGLPAVSTLPAVVPRRRCRQRSSCGSRRRPTPVARRWWPSRRAGYPRSPSPRAARPGLQVHHLPEAVKAEVAVRRGRDAASPTSVPAAARRRSTWIGTPRSRSAPGRGKRSRDGLIDALPDAVPTVSFVGEPRATHRSVLRIDVDATDDYGIAELALLLAPQGREDETERVTLLKPGNQPPHLATGAYQDLTAHPLAGLTAVLRLEAVDAIGQRGQSGPIEIVPAGARIPPSAGARDHRRAAQAGGDTRERASEVAAQPRRARRHAGGTAPADRGAARAAGRRRRVWR